MKTSLRNLQCKVALKSRTGDLVSGFKRESVGKVMNVILDMKLAIITRSIWCRNGDLLIDFICFVVYFFFINLRNVKNEKYLLLGHPFVESIVWFR